MLLFCFNFCNILQGIWVVSMCLAVPQVSDFSIHFFSVENSIKSIIKINLSLQTLFTLHLDEVYRICIPKPEHQHLFVVSTFLIFVIPMSIITILYILIGLQLRKSKIIQRGAVNGSSVRLKVL
jgi:neuromedin U receptor 1